MMHEIEPCPSTIHQPGCAPLARIPGTFDARHISGHEPERTAYCIRCARAGYIFRVFRPDSETVRRAFDRWEERLMRRIEAERIAEQHAAARAVWAAYDRRRRARGRRR